ncbi:hypothetical protein LCGC14_1642870 [marine sediment metagenome]|uniref:Uncharacterized protein n=1 Tax=marine sediment metagenome TaxID=412755 RepID=A0A0F9KEY5_9ZZZZ
MNRLKCIECGFTETVDNNLIMVDCEKCEGDLTLRSIVDDE